MLIIVIWFATTYNENVDFVFDAEQSDAGNDDIIVFGPSSSNGTFKFSSFLHVGLVAAGVQ